MNVVNLLRRLSENDWSRKELRDLADDVENGKPTFIRDLVHAAPQAAPAVDGRAEAALLKVLSAVQRYLPPDGPSCKDTLNEIIAVVDPWPLGTLEKS